MKIGIVGAGIVGRATARCFMEHADVRVYDVVRERATHSLPKTLASEIIFVCLPTPQRNDSLECDTSIVEEFFASVKGCQANFALRSTVPIGTTRRLREQYGLNNLAHNPEFVTARCAMTDAQIPARNIIGTPGPYHINEGAKILDWLYGKRFPGVPIHCMSSDESEATKLFANGFFATKVSYWNECRTLADKLDLDWNRVMEGVLSDGRIAHSHTKVPGPDGKFGFGPDTPNACLPKDLASLIHALESNGLRADVTRGAHERNKDDRAKPLLPKSQS